VHVARLNLIGANDDAVWAAAQKMEAYVLTRDSDFDARAARAAKGGVIRLTMGQAKYEVMLHRLEAVWPDVAARVARGERVIVV
jgi:predicted nuclease of predicted toxin-antitoxin system